MTRPGIAAGLLALALTTGLGACGGTGAGSPGASARGRADAAVRADAICASAQAQAHLVSVPAALLSDAAAAATYYRRVFPIVHRETEQIRALTPPPDMSSKWRAFVAAQLADDRVLETLKRKAEAKDPSGVTYYHQLAPAIRDVAIAAKKVGADICAGGRPG